MVKDRVARRCHMRRRVWRSQSRRDERLPIHWKIISHTENLSEKRNNFHLTLNAQRFVTFISIHSHTQFYQGGEKIMSRLSPSSHNNAQQSKRQPVYGATRFRIWLCFPLAAKCFMNLWKKGEKLLFCYL